MPEKENRTSYNGIVTSTLASHFELFPLHRLVLTFIEPDEEKNMFIALDIVIRINLNHVK